MSTEAEIVTYAGHRYRVAGKSGPGVEPQVGMVVRYAKALYSITHFRADGSFALECAGRLTSFLESPGYGGLWANHACEILVPIEASPPAETPRCEAPGWCGLRYHDPRVPFWAAGLKRITPCSQREPGPVNYKGCTGATCDHPTYCSPACADRARAAAAPKECGKDIGGVSASVACNREPGHLGNCNWSLERGPLRRIDQPASPIPAGYRLAKGWKVLETPGRRGGGTWRCWSKEFDCPKRSYETLFASDMETGKGACLDCAERRGAIERVEAEVRIGIDFGAEEAAAATIFVDGKPVSYEVVWSRPVEHAPCLSHHPEFGSRCERKGPHVGASSRCWGYRPGTSERVRWQTTPDPAETRAERWRRTHPGYGHKPEHDMHTQIMMTTRGLTTFSHGVATMAAATNHKPAPWTPSDPEADIPWVWGQ